MWKRAASSGASLNSSAPPQTLPECPVRVLWNIWHGSYETIPCTILQVCLEEMAPPTNIFQCTNGHLVCAQCRQDTLDFTVKRLLITLMFRMIFRYSDVFRSSLEAAICPRCRSDITGRATDMEQFLRQVFKTISTTTILQQKYRRLDYHLNNSRAICNRS